MNYSGALCTPAISYEHTLDHALLLIDAGVAVFPVELIGAKKKPAITGWRKGASTNERLVRMWFSGEKMLIGVPTGKSAGYDALDVDPRHGGNQWLAENQYRLPDTVVHETLHGGSHLLFRRYDGMRNSVGKIGVGVDVRGEGGFIVYWPGHGRPCSGSAIAPWPDWLAELAMAGRARRRTGAVALDTRKPPSARHVTALLDRMPNPLDCTRDTYVDVMLAAKGCIDALTEAGDLDDFDAEARIIDAAIGWADRWEGGGEVRTDEAAKWDSDWAYREAPLAGWQTLARIAGGLIPGYREEQAAETFAATVIMDGPDPSYQGNLSWPNMLRLSKNGAVKPNLLMNVNIALRHAPEWQGVLAKNLFTGNVDLLAKPPYGRVFTGPHPLDNVDVLRTKEWMEINHVEATKDTVFSAIKMMAENNAYHPILRMLDGFRWDKTLRADTWMIRHLGVEDTPLHRAYSTRFLISLIARARDPGCKVDTVPVLEGPQGLMKSELLRELASPEWFVDHMPDLASKDAQLQLVGVWLVEFAEYGQLGRADTNRAKNFITIRKDRLRRPYEIVPENEQRQCVMVVTLNPEAQPYLKDVTGNRRFWPMLCGATWTPGQQVNLEAFRRERDQLLAEADYRYGQGERWWLHERELIAAHLTSVAERVDGGPLFGRVAKALQSLVANGTTEPSYDQVCAEMGLLSAEDQTVALYYQIGRAVTLLGWTRKRVQKDGVRDTFYTLLS